MHIEIFQELGEIPLTSDTKGTQRYTQTRTYARADIEKKQGICTYAVYTLYPVLCLPSLKTGCTVLVRFMVRGRFKIRIRH